MDQAVAAMLGAQALQIAALQIQVEDLTEQLAEAKKPAEKKPRELHEVKPAS